MSLEDFKSTWATDLGDLSAARVSTLWKKSKTSSREDITAAILASRAAAAKDHARRGKVTVAEIPSGSQESPSVPRVTNEVPAAEIPSQNNNPALDSVVHTIEHLVESAPADPVVAEVDRRWSRIFKPLEIDKNILTEVIRKLYQHLMAKDISDSDRIARINELYECVDRLIAMRAKYGKSVDVLKALGQK